MLQLFHDGLALSFHWPLDDFVLHGRGYSFKAFFVHINLLLSFIGNLLLIDGPQSPARVVSSWLPREGAWVIIVGEKARRVWITVVNRDERVVAEETTVRVGLLSLQIEPIRGENLLVSHLGLVFRCQLARWDTVAETLLIFFEDAATNPRIESAHHLELITLQLGPHWNVHLYEGQHLLRPLAALEALLGSGWVSNPNLLGRKLVVYFLRA